MTKTTMSSGKRFLLAPITSLFVLTAGAAHTQAAAISLNNPDFETGGIGEHYAPPGTVESFFGWTANYYEVYPMAPVLVVNSGSRALNLSNFPGGTSQATPTRVFQTTTAQITAGSIYTLTFYAGVRTDTGYAAAVNAVASLRADGTTLDLASFTVDGLTAPLGTMQQYTLSWQAPDSGAFLGQNLQVHFQSSTTLPDDQYWHQISIDSVRLSAVPEPATTAFFGMALFGLGMIRRRRSA